MMAQGHLQVGRLPAPVYIIYLSIYDLAQGFLVTVSVNDLSHGAAGVSKEPSVLINTQEPKHTSYLGINKLLLYKCLYRPHVFIQI